MQERRRFVRITDLNQASYKLKDTPGKMSVVAVKNISLIGMSLLLEENLAQGAILELSFVLPGSGKPVLAEGEVVWQRVNLADKLSTGVKFVKIQDADRERLSAYIAACAQKTEENREFVRCAFESEIRFSFIDKPDKEYKARGEDISRGGLKMIVLEKLLEMRDKLNLYFSLPKSKDIILNVQGKVVWVNNKEAGMSEIGIMFYKISFEDRLKIKQFIEEECKQGHSD